MPAALRVNKVARYLRGALYQSYYPDGVYTAASVETLKNDIAWAKKFGFNFLRIHIKVDDPLLLYWADKLGILLMADFPNFGEGGDTPLGRKRFEVMMRETIERDFNHPSIFAWCLFNETWGFGGQTRFLEELTSAAMAGAAAAAAVAAPRAAKPKRPAAGARPGMEPPQVWVQEMWELGKELDPNPAGGGHERLPLGTPRILPALRHRHQFLAFLHQRLSARPRRTSTRSLGRPSSARVSITFRASSTKGSR